MGRDVYQLLEISPDASRQQIDEAYAARMRELSSGGAHVTALLEVQLAYSALGHAAAGGVASGVPLVVDVPSPSVPVQSALVEPVPPAAEAVEPPIEVSLTRSFDTFHPSFEEIYERLWSNFTKAARPKSETVASLTIDIPVSRQQAAEGGVARVLVPTLIACPVCRGQGGVGPFACLRCEGKGNLEIEAPLFVPFAAGADNSSVEVSLAPLGIRNFFLIVRFRVSDEEG